MKTFQGTIRKFIKDVLYRPRGVQLDENSYIFPPHRLFFRSHLWIGKNTVIRPDSYICPLRTYRNQKFNSEISIGDSVYIGNHAFLVAIDSIRIDDACVLSEYVYITDNQHGFAPDGGLIMEQPLESKGPIHIGKQCFIGFRACIMPGVTLGEHCVVGANSVVTRSFPSYSMIAGAPAKLIKIYSLQLKEWLSVDKHEDTI